MASDEANVWYYRRPAATDDFDYRIEAGGAVSESHRVAVVEPITLGAAHITIRPPAYAAAGHDQDLLIEGLGELVALEHSTITFDLRFVPKPASAILEFTAQADADSNKPVKQRYPLNVADDGTTTLTVPAKATGTFALKAEARARRAERIPAPALKVYKDEPPKLPRISGIGEKARQVRPTEKLVVECAATDDVAIAKATLEWRIDNGSVQSLPLVANGLPAVQIEGRAVLSLMDKVKVGQKLSCLAGRDRQSQRARSQPRAANDLLPGPGSMVGVRSQRDSPRHSPSKTSRIARQRLRRSSRKFAPNSLRSCDEADDSSPRDA